MSLGVVKIIPSGAHVQILVPAGSSYPSVAILNPNDGVVYVARNRDLTSTDYGAWDWKCPSQSFALVPGPFSTVGLYYIDQSGAGRNGEITIYGSSQRLDIPFFNAIGRSLIAAQTTLDITEGTQPANPGVGLARLWADANDDLHLLNSGGVDTQWVDFETVLGGVLTGSLPNPGLAANAATNAAGATQNSGGSTTSATFVDMPSLSVALTTLAGSPIFAWLSTVVQCNIAGAVVSLAINVDGIDSPIASLILASANTDYSIGGCMVLGLSAATHTIKGRFRTNAGTALMDGSYASSLLVAEYRR